MDVCSQVLTCPLSDVSLQTLLFPNISKLCCHLVYTSVLAAHALVLLLCVYGLTWGIPGISVTCNRLMLLCDLNVSCNPRQTLQVDKRACLLCFWGGWYLPIHSHNVDLLERDEISTKVSFSIFFLMRPHSVAGVPWPWTQVPSASVSPMLALQTCTKISNWEVYIFRQNTWIIIKFLLCFPLLLCKRFSCKTCWL